MKLYTKYVIYHEESTVESFYTYWYHVSAIYLKKITHIRRGCHLIDNAGPDIDMDVDMMGHSLRVVDN